MVLGLSEAGFDLGPAGGATFSRKPSLGGLPGLLPLARGALTASGRGTGAALWGPEHFPA